jgi:hypothetical protein
MAAKTGSKKAGRNKAKCAAYASMHRREQNKVKRVLRSSGIAAATKYAEAHNVKGVLARLVQ